MGGRNGTTRCVAARYACLLIAGGETACGRDGVTTTISRARPALTTRTYSRTVRLRHREACPTMPHCSEIWSSSIQPVLRLDLPRIRKPIFSPLYSAAPTTCHHAKRKHTARAKSRWCHTRRATSSCCSICAILFQGATNHAKARIRLSAY